MKCVINLPRRLNLQYLLLTNRTYSCGAKDLPAVYCDTDVYPDYLALFSEIRDYKKTNRTAVCFYQYDDVFDGIHGLFNAIYYGDVKLLARFKKRFEGVKIFLAPDYSEIGDIQNIENEYRLFKARIVSLWLTLELGAIVIPSITYPSERSFEFALDGLKECTVVAFSTKGYMNPAGKLDRDLLSRAIRYTVDNLNLKAIIVYDSCGDYQKAWDLFAYAREKGVEIVIPQNSLKKCNERKKGGKRIA